MQCCHLASLLCKYICLASDFRVNFMLMLCRSNLDIKPVIGFSSEKNQLHLVVFLTVQAVTIINSRNVNVVVHQNSIIHQMTTKTLQ